MERDEGQKDRDQTMHCLELRGPSCLPLNSSHAYLDMQFIDGGEVCSILADNLVAQSKNSTTLWYLAWCVITGQQHRIQLNFILSGE